MSEWVQIGLFLERKISYMDMMRQTNGDRYSHWIILFVCITQVTSSIATATFFHFVTVSPFFIVPLAFPNEEEENNENTYFENNS